MTKTKKKENASRKRAAYHFRGRKLGKKGVEVDHKNSNPNDNRKSNLHAISRKANRSKGAMEAVRSRRRRARNGGKY